MEAGSSGHVLHEIDASHVLSRVASNAAAHPHARELWIPRWCTGAFTSRLDGWAPHLADDGAPKRLRLPKSVTSTNSVPPKRKRMPPNRYPIPALRPSLDVQPHPFFTRSNARLILDGRKPVVKLERDPTGTSLIFTYVLGSARVRRSWRKSVATGATAPLNPPPAREGHSAQAKKPAAPQPAVQSRGRAPSVRVLPRRTERTAAASRTLTCRPTQSMGHPQYSPMSVYCRMPIRRTVEQWRMCISCASIVPQYPEPFVPAARPTVVEVPEYACTGLSRLLSGVETTYRLTREPLSLLRLTHKAESIQPLQQRLRSRRLRKT